MISARFHFVLILGEADELSLVQSLLQWIFSAIHFIETKVGFNFMLNLARLTIVLIAQACVSFVSLIDLS